MASKKRRKKKFTPKHTNLEDKITNAVIEDLEKGVATWVRSWDKLGGAPRAAETGREYNGINYMYLSMQQTCLGYETPLWGTGQSWAKLMKMPSISEDVSPERRVYKGLESTPVIFMKRFEKLNAATGEKESRFFMAAHSVFNLDQLNGITEVERARILARRGIVDSTVERLVDRDLRCEEVIETTGARVIYQGDQPCYRIAEDTVYMPVPKTFHTMADYYATHFHELGHWTGHSSRLARDIRGGFGTEKYAFEELVAEMTSAFVCGRLRVEGKLQHAEYMGSWIKRLKNDNKFIFRAAAAAAKAAELIVPREMVHFGTHENPRVLPDLPPG
jgi:antirestriction protein ArdC